MTLPSSSSGRIWSSLVTCSKNRPKEALPGIESSGVSAEFFSDQAQTEPDSPSPMPSSVTMVASPGQRGQ
jgi:hypothetical protein